MKKGLVSIVLSLAMAASLIGCSQGGEDKGGTSKTTESERTGLGASESENEMFEIVFIM